MITPIVQSTLVQSVQLASTKTLGAVLFAEVLQATGNRELIIVAIISNITVLFVALIGGYISLRNNRTLVEIAKLPAKFQEVIKSVDGVAHELASAKEEGSVAKQAAARAEGQLQEVDRARAETPAVAAPAAQVEVVNKEPIIVDTPSGKDALP